MKHDENDMIFDSLIKAKMEHYETKAPDSAFDNIISQVNIQPLEKKSGSLLFFNVKYAVAAAFIGVTLISSFYLAYKEFYSVENIAVQPVKKEVNPSPSLPKVAIEQPVNTNTQVVPKREIEKNTVAKKQENNKEEKVNNPIPDNNNIAQQNTTEPNQDKAPEIQSHEVDYPVNALKIIPNDQPNTDEIKVISPQVKNKKKKK